MECFYKRNDFLRVFVTLLPINHQTDRICQSFNCKPMSSDVCAWLNVSCECKYKLVKCCTQPLFSWPKVSLYKVKRRANDITAILIDERAPAAFLCSEFSLYWSLLSRPFFSATTSKEHTSSLVVQSIQRLKIISAAKS